MMLPALPLADVGDQRQWAVLGVMFVLAIIFAIINVVASAIFGPSRKGNIKDDPYESGVDPSGTTHKRFNVRFYLVAMIFLVFDVEVLFFIPWITIFPQYALVKGIDPTLTMSLSVLFGSAIVFTAVVLLAYVYAWAKGVFRWD